MDVPLLPEERDLHKLFGVDASLLENEVKEFVKELFSGSLEMDAAGLEKALMEKCVNPAKSKEENPGPDKRPFFDKLPPIDQTYYRDNLKKHSLTSVQHLRDEPCFLLSKKVAFQRQLLSSKKALIQARRQLVPKLFDWHCMFSHFNVFYFFTCDTCLD